MRIDNTMRHTVAFLVQEDKNGVTRPMASAFCVSVNFENLYLESYLVSARHNIEFARAAEKPLFLRVNTTKKEYEDIPLDIDAWIPHPTSDVTVMPITLPVGVLMAHIPFGMLLKSESLKSKALVEGSEICMPALFSPFYGKKIMHAVIRTGRLALVPEEKLPVKLGPCTQGEIEGYLIETLSYGGCSGAPVLIEHYDFSIVSMDPYEVQPTKLLGLISSHYDIPREIQGIELPLNAGIAVVVPAQGIVDILLYEEIKTARDRNFENLLYQLQKRFQNNECPFLSDEERNVLNLKWGLPNTEQSSLTEIASKFETSEEAVKQIEHRALLKLRNS